MEINKFNNEQKQFILDNYKGISNLELASKFNAKFNTNFSVSKIKQYKNNHHLDSGLKCYFPAGHIPFQKGKKWADWMSLAGQENSRKTTFKKGHIPHNHKPIGSTRFSKDGYIEIKVAEPNKWKLKHRLVYEKAYGTIPKGTKIIFLDGNKQNCNLSNLELVKNIEELKLNKLRLRSSIPELTKAGINIVKIDTRIKELQESKNK